jgi:molybdenum cofactor cytidylyltransferase
MESCKLILLAAGFSRRYGGNKLLSPWHGAPMYLHGVVLLAELHRRHPDWAPLVVTQYPEIGLSCAARGIPWLHNPNAADGISSSLKLGLSQAAGEAAAFFVADQPQLTPDSGEGLLTGFFQSGKGMGTVTWEGEPGNPCVFSKPYFPELLALEGDRGGKKVILAHWEDVFCYPVSDPGELMDIDTKE